MKLLISALLLTGVMPTSAQPNVIIIMVDDMGWRDLSCYGSTFYETPHIDSFAQTAMRFTEGYSASPACSPTRSNVLTGQMPARTGFTAAGGHLTDVREQVERTTGPGFYRGTSPRTATFLTDGKPSHTESRSMKVDL